MLSMERISLINQEKVVRATKLALGFLVFLIGIVALFHFNRPPDFGVTDFVQYWTASYLLMSGQNPYDRLVVDAVQVGLAMKEHPILMWNPPHIVPIIFWISFLPFSWAADLWLVLSVILFVSAVLVTLPVTPKIRPIDALIKNKIALLYIFSFYPLFLMLAYGQLSAVLLASLAGYFYFAVNRKEGTLRDTIIGGIFLGIGTIKPHLLWLPYLILLYHSIPQRSFRTLAGMMGCITVLYLLTIAFFPTLLADYLNAWSESPIHWKTPTIGSWLQGITGIHQLWVRLLPTLIGVIFTTIMLARRLSIIRYFSYELLVSSIPLSLVMSPYGWVYDQLLLIPLGLLMVSRSSTLGCVLIGFNVGMMSMGDIGQEWMVWFPIAYFLTFLFGCKRVPK